MAILEADSRMPEPEPPQHEPEHMKVQEEMEVRIENAVTICKIGKNETY